jgi:hypothetical protein
LVMTRRRPVRCGKSRPVVSAAGRGTVACALPANPVNEFPKADVVTVSRSLELALFMDRQARRLEAARLALPFWPLADWLKMKNSNAPTVTREAEKDWGRGKWR